MWFTAADELPLLRNAVHAMDAGGAVRIVARVPGNTSLHDIAPDGRVEYAAVSFGGFLGIGDKLFAVPMDAIHLNWKDNKLNQAHVNVTEQTIKQRKGFDDSKWPEHADRGFVGTEPVHVVH